MAIAFAIPLAVALAALGAHAVSPSGPVYSVSQVVAGLRQQPRAWRGRTVVVVGKAADVLVQGPAPLVQAEWLHPPPGDDVLIRLVPSEANLHPDVRASGPSLWVTPQLSPQRPTITGALGRLPLVGRLVPASNDLYTFTTFRLTVLSSPGAVCATLRSSRARQAPLLGPIRRCDEALLRAATP